MTGKLKADQQMKKILIFIDWYLPGFKAGGPIKSCVSLVERMKSSYHFRVVTADTDLNETAPYPDVQPDVWSVTTKGTEVFYCSGSFLKRKNLEKIILKEQPDVIYLNSMFSLNFTLLPLLIIRQNNIKCKVVVAPRGMLSKGALALKPAKKRLFLSFSKVMGLFNKVTFHASTKIEVQEIKSVFGEKVNIVHAINLTPEAIVLKIPRVKSENKMSLVYVGRISEVKNLLLCLKVLGKINKEYEISFDIYGPSDDAGYLKLCQNEIASLPSNVKATLKGTADNSGITSLLSNYHFLYLLSMNENFGHAIVEGLTAGCPVIIGNRTPWQNLESKKCGWDLPLEQEDKIVAVLNTAAAMNQGEYDEWSSAATDFAMQIHENKKTIEDHHRLFDTSQ